MMYEEHGPEWTNRVYVADPPTARHTVGNALRLTLMARFASTGRFRHEQISPGIAVHVVRSGRGVIRADGIDYEVSAGDVFTFFQRGRYRYADRPATPWRYTWCALTGPEVSAALATAGITERHPHQPGRAVATFEPLFTEIERVWAASPTPPLHPTAAAWWLVDLLARNHPPGPTATDRPVAEVARTLIDLRYMTGTTIGDIARHIRVDRSTLFRRFRETYNTTPKRYLDSLRLAHARELLRAGIPVAETSQLCGFTDSHYFSRAYKNTYGHPPSSERP